MVFFSYRIYYKLLNVKFNCAVIIITQAQPPPPLESNMIILSALFIFNAVFLSARARQKASKNYKNITGTGTKEYKKKQRIFIPEKRIKNAGFIF